MTRWAIANPVAATMAMLALCVLGIASYLKLNVEQMPDVAPPVAFIDIQWPGAAPAAVERELTRLVEESVNGIAGVRRILSRTFEGRSQTSVEFGLDADMDRAMQEVRDRVAVVQARFPTGAKPPAVSRYDNENSRPVAVVAMMSATRSSRELALLAERIVLRRLERVEGVAAVETAGLMRRELRVDLDPDRLRAYAITPAELSAALREANGDHPVGLLSDASADALLRVEGRVVEARRFADMVVAQRRGLPLRLGDLGTLVEREREPENLARVDGRPALSFDVQRRQDANVVRTGAAVRNALDELRATLPPDVELRLVHDASAAVHGQLDGLRRTLVEGALLTVAIVFLFLHSWRSTVITALTLPISVLASFIAVHAFGFTLNFMTMMALSLCIGLLVDDAIVVRENIVRHLGRGLDHRRAAQQGTDEIGLAVMATTFAVCAVFVPVAFMEGFVGRFFHAFGITVAVAVLVSLVVSFTLDPMLSSVWPDPPGRAHRWLGAPGRAVERGMVALEEAYARTMRWVFAVPHRRRLAVLGGALAAFAGALALVPAVGTELLPQADEGFTQLSLRLPVGSSLARTEAKVAQAEQLIAALPEVRTVASRIAGVGDGQVLGRNQATLYIALVPRQERKRTQKQLEDAIRTAISALPGVEVAVGLDRPIYVALLGSDPEVLTRLASDFAARVRQVPGIADVELSAKPGVPAYAVRLRPDAIRELGLNAAQLAVNLRAYVQGEPATWWTTPDGEQVELLLRLPAAQRERVPQLARLPVAFAKDGTPIALEAVADVQAVDNPEVIRRQDLQRREAIFAGVRGRPAGDVGADVEKLTREIALPPGYRFDIGGATRDQQEVFASLLGAMGLAVVFIYLVLASQFASFVQPVAIMASLPLALVGVMPALWLSGSTLNVFSMIGLVMLMGLVTKNAILLVDVANRARRAGATPAEALRQAGLLRLRPIVMTTAAMVAGMLPLALALHEGGELQAAMGRAVIGGVLGSAVLTLVVVPVAWSYLVRTPRAVARASTRAIPNASP